MTRQAFRSILPILIALCALLRAGDDESFNAKVVAFCERNLNEKVGDGECAALAAQALRFAGARGRNGDNPGKEDYVWGKEIFVLEHESQGLKTTGKFEAIQPGDIIQYRDAVFKGKKNKGTYNSSAPHHTAIVYKVNAKGRELKILEQNANGRKTVAEAALHLDDLKEGWIRIYHPVAEEKK